MNLYDQLKLVFEKKSIGSYNFDDTLHDDKNAAEYLRMLLKDESFVQGNDKLDTAQSRARHSLLTFLFGMYLRNCFEMDDVISSKLSRSFEKYWMFVALYHDYGYFSSHISDASYDYSTLKHILYDDRIKIPPHILSIPREDILGYDRYARWFHSRNPDDKERIDHGILGGALVYDRLFNSGGLEEDYLIGVAFTISQHNIFKSSDETTDCDYLKYGLNTLLSVSTWRITKETPLLLFLSLIDTIECVKKFSRSENSDKYLQTKTVLQGIDINVNGEQIELDYSMLKKNIDNKDLKSEFDSYLRSLLNLKAWTEFNATVNDMKVTIKIN